MTRACEVLGHLEELLTALQQNAWQQREALVALRVGAVEALAAQQQLLLQKLEQYQQRCVPLLEDIQREPQLRRRWERMRIHAAEVRRLLQLNRLLAQRAQQHSAALLEALTSGGPLYNWQA